MPKKRKQPSLEQQSKRDDTTYPMIAHSGTIAFIKKSKNRGIDIHQHMLLISSKTGEISKIDSLKKIIKSIDRLLCNTQDTNNFNDCIIDFADQLVIKELSTTTNEALKITINIARLFIASAQGYELIIADLKKMENDLCIHTQLFDQNSAILAMRDANVNRMSWFSKTILEDIQLPLSLLKEELVIKKYVNNINQATALIDQLIEKLMVSDHDFISTQSFNSYNLPWQDQYLIIEEKSKARTREKTLSSSSSSIFYYKKIDNQLDIQKTKKIRPLSPNKF